jgi:hypothetical protein
MVIQADMISNRATCMLDLYQSSKYVRVALWGVTVKARDKPNPCLHMGYDTDIIMVSSSES